MVREKIGLDEDNVRRMIETDARSWRTEGEMGDEMNKSIMDNIGEHIEPFCRRLESRFVKGSSLYLADIGGGNGSVSRKIARRLGDKYDLRIDVLDLDKNKFPANSSMEITYHVHDARDCGRANYDGIICRYMLHHNSEVDQYTILRRLGGSLLPNGVASIIDVSFDNYLERLRMTCVYNLISRETGTNWRHWMTEAEYRDAFRKAGLFLETYISTRQQYGADDFIKERFKLSEKQLDSVRKQIGERPLEGRIFNALFVKEKFLDPGTKIRS